MPLYPDGSILGEMNTKKNLCGTLFIVATPIGNLDDITFRAIHTLKAVDLIAAEDTRRTRVLLTHFDIKTRLVSYHDHNAVRMVDVLLGKLQSGMSLALVSDGGTPCISDPGFKLITAAREQDIPVIPIPGPSAVITALVMAGLPSEKFVFEGYLPKSQGVRAKRWSLLQKEPRAIVIFEAPHRIAQFCSEIALWMPQRQAAICREMTKIHEEVICGKGEQMPLLLSGTPIKGELTIVIAAHDIVPISIQDIEEAVFVAALRETGSVREAAQQISDEQGILFRKAYRKLLEITRTQEISQRIDDLE